MLTCSVLICCGVAYLAVGGRGLRWQERIFTAMAWMPKATVQAAIGALALDEATTDREKAMGQDILAIAVLSILCTAPLGAIAISFFGPRLLVLDKYDESKKQDELCEKDVESKKTNGELQTTVPVEGFG